MSSVAKPNFSRSAHFVCHNTIQKSLPPDTFSGLKIAAKYVCSRGSAPDPAGQLTVLPRPPSCIGGEKGTGWKGRVGQERRGEGAGEGRGRDKGKECPPPLFGLSLCPLTQLVKNSQVSTAQIQP